MGLFAKKYIYVSVCFLGSKVPYYYRTEDRHVKVNDVVIVPAGNEQKAAIVVAREVFSEKKMPYPIAQTRLVLRKASWSERRDFKKSDKSARVANSANTVRAAKRITPRFESNAPRRTGKWYKEEHLWGKVTYRCSRCGAMCWDPHDVCPKCKSANKKIKNDPVWVDEMAMYDGE